MAKQTKVSKEPRKEYIHGFCDPECKYYKKKPMVSFTNEKAEMEICTWGNSVRSFGCLGACPLGNNGTNY